MVEATSDTKSSLHQLKLNKNKHLRTSINASDMINQNNNEESIQESIPDEKDDDGSSMNNDKSRSRSSGDGGFMGWDHDKRQESRSSYDADAVDNINPNPKAKANDLDGTNGSYSFDASSSSSSINNSSSSTNSEEETKWSINVRLNSVVDLPSSILPSVPLCPLLKFSILTITNEQQLHQIDSISAATRRAQYEQSKDEQQKRYPQTSLKLTHGLLADFQKNTSLATVASMLAQEQEQARAQLQSHLHDDVVGDDVGGDGNDDVGGNGNSNGNDGHDTKINSNDPHSQDLASIVKSSSGKIMSPKDNGMMEWHEDMRWDNITAPLQTVLAIELSARAVFPSSSNHGNGSIGMNQASSSAQQARHNQKSKGASSLDYADHVDDYASSSYQDQSNGNTSDSGTGIGTGIGNSPNASGKGNGILGLWRKGKKSLAERRNRRGHSNLPDHVHDHDNYSEYGDDSLQASGSASASVYSRRNSFISNSGDELDNANKAAAVARYLMEHGNNSNSNSINSNNQGPDLSNMSSLDVSASNADTMLQTSNLDKLTKQGTVLDHSSIADGDIRLGTLLIPISNLPLEDEIPRVEKWYQFDNGQDNLNPAPWRDPTVLLDISLCTTSTLNQLEDEMYAVAGGTAGVTVVATVPLEESIGAHAAHSMEDSHGAKGENVDPSAPVADFRECASDISHAIAADNSASGPPSKSRQKNGSIDLKTLNQDAKMAEQLELEEEERLTQNGPYLETGIVDYMCVVGPKDLGDLKLDTKEKGWINSEPDCCVLEQFPSNEFHQNNGRDCVLPEGVEQWCFPEGCRLWRGSDPPTHMDMNLKRFSAASPPRMASSVAAFDACLNCTTSFMWWVLSSMSDVYGSSISKTYGAVIRFYAEVPGSISNTEDDRDNRSAKIWCPLGICLTSSMPIVGILEAVLLRLCEKLALTGGAKFWEGTKSIIHSDITNLILNYQRPISGVMHCSVPFLSGDGDRLHVSLPPFGGLPPLPHGASVTSVCRLLGAEGLTALLAAVLTECKILVHSADVANLAMVGEVITALMCPFTWQLPNIPVLPLSMITFVEAPVSYFIGVPTCNMKFVDKSALADVVVIDLDNGFSSPDYFDGRRNELSTTSIPLPASVSSNISKAVFRLLREEEEIQEEFGASTFSDSRYLSRLEAESRAERDFRITIAHQVCGLIRGYQECLFFVSAAQPVFNRDRFFRQAPALFEDRRGVSPSGSSTPLSSPVVSLGKIISPRSKRFLSGLVNSQHFHALLEKLDHETNAFFHVIMDTFQDEADDGNAACTYGSAKQRSVVAKLRASLDVLEQNVPTYHAHNHCLDDLEEEVEDYDFIGGYFSSFTSDLLQPVKRPSIPSSRNLPGDVTIASIASKSNFEAEETEEEIKKLSLKELVELDKIPWVYRKIFDIDLAQTLKSEKPKIWMKIHLKEALGEKKFSEWKIEQESEFEEDVEDGNPSHTKSTINSSLDLTKLISNLRSDEVPYRNIVSKLKRGSASDRTVIRRYIEKAYEIVEELKEGRLEVDEVEEQFNEINAEVDTAMKSPSAQRFLMSVLSQRSRLQNETRKVDNRATLRPGYRIEVSTSNLHPLVFDCLYRLCISMLEACHHEYDYEAAYKLLIHTTGFCTADENMTVCFMTKQIAAHTIYGDLRLWDRVLLIHQQDRQRDKNGNDTKTPSAESAENDEYEATVSTLYEMLGYGMPADDLARFAYRVAEEKFYSTDKEQKLLTLARRLAVKCDEASPEEELENDEIDQQFEGNLEDGGTVDHGKEGHWEELQWTHPGMASQQSSGPLISGGAYTEQAPITGLTSFGGSIIATGALDGSVYLASTLHLDREKRGKIAGQFVRGVQLRWPDNRLATGSAGQQDNMTGGAVSCLVATHGSTQHKHNSFSFNSDGVENQSAKNSLAGCRLVGGTTGGNLSVWDISNAMEDVLGCGLPDDIESLASTVPEINVHPNGSHSSHVRSTSSPRAYNKKSTKAQTGVSIGGHRGGVTCLSVPSQIYRPDSLISGGNDGLIKFWSLRTRSEIRQSGRRQTVGGRTPRTLFSSSSNNTKTPGKDTLDVLAGHGGRILCVEVAWHGDRLLSGAADRTVKLWDLASQSGGRCLQTMHGHTGWVTHGRYWGQNTIVSASSDRSIALWDVRSGSSPLFVLRYHNGPISDLYLESRSSFWMTSAANDGTIGTWDFRMMKTLNGDIDSGKPVTRAHTNRCPLAQMCHANQSSGPVLLGRGVGTKYGQGERSIMSVGVDNIVKQWDALSGKLLDENKNSSRSKISCFKSFAPGESLNQGQVCDDGGNTSLTLGGTITTSWDGTVRLRRLRLG